LKTYPQEAGRSFPATRRFTANLFGISLDIPQTLPFQEQDSIVAACATSALWSVLQATAKEFQHALLTPIEITDIHTSNDVHGVIFYDDVVQLLMTFIAQSAAVFALPDLSEAVQRILRTIARNNAI
jgi:hypothetical protein